MSNSIPLSRYPGVELPRSEGSRHKGETQNLMAGIRRRRVPSISWLCGLSGTTAILDIDIRFWVIIDDMMVEVINTEL